MLILDLISHFEKFYKEPIVRSKNLQIFKNKNIEFKIKQIQKSTKKKVIKFYGIINETLMSKITNNKK